MLDESTEHKVVPIKQTICVQCAASYEHRRHVFIDLLECVERKREASQTDLQELESSIPVSYTHLTLPTICSV